MVDSLARRLSHANAHQFLHNRAGGNKFDLDVRIILSVADYERQYQNINIDDVF